ncbi:TPA: hypothetical protein ACGPAV_001344, partial [Streptococcus suis]
NDVCLQSETTSNTEVVFLLFTFISLGYSLIWLFHNNIHQFSWLQQSTDRLLEVGNGQTNEAIVTW